MTQQDEPGLEPLDEVEESVAENDEVELDMTREDADDNDEDGDERIHAGGNDENDSGHDDDMDPFPPKQPGGAAAPPSHGPFGSSPSSSLSGTNPSKQYMNQQSSAWDGAAAANNASTRMAMASSSSSSSPIPTHILAPPSSASSSAPPPPPSASSIAPEDSSSSTVHPVSNNVSIPTATPTTTNRYKNLMRPKSNKPWQQDSSSRLAMGKSSTVSTDNVQEEEAALAPEEPAPTGSPDKDDHDKNNNGDGQPPTNHAFLPIPSSGENDIDGAREQKEEAAEKQPEDEESSAAEKSDNKDASQDGIDNQDAMEQDGPMSNDGFQAANVGNDTQEDLQEDVTLKKSISSDDKENLENKENQVDSQEDVAMNKAVSPDGAYTQDASQEDVTDEIASEGEQGDQVVDSYTEDSNVKETTVEIGTSEPSKNVAVAEEEAATAQNVNDSGSSHEQEDDPTETEKPETSEEAENTTIAPPPVQQVTNNEPDENSECDGAADPKEEKFDIEAAQPEEDSNIASPLSEQQSLEEISSTDKATDERQQTSEEAAYQEKPANDAKVAISDDSNKFNENNQREASGQERKPQEDAEAGDDKENSSNVQVMNQQTIVTMASPSFEDLTKIVEEDEVDDEDDDKPKIAPVNATQLSASTLEIVEATRSADKDDEDNEEIGQYLRSMTDGIFKNMGKPPRPPVKDNENVANDNPAAAKAPPLSVATSGLGNQDDSNKKGTIDDTDLTEEQGPNTPVSVKLLRKRFEKNNTPIEVLEVRGGGPSSLSATLSASKSEDDLDDPDFDGNDNHSHNPGSVISRRYSATGYRRGGCDDSSALSSEWGGPNPEYFAGGMEVFHRQQKLQKFNERQKLKETWIRYHCDKEEHVVVSLLSQPSAHAKTFAQQQAEMEAQALSMDANNAAANGGADAKVSSTTTVTTSDGTPKSSPVLVDYQNHDYRGFVFVVHNDFGLVLLQCTRKKKKGHHWQLPGGHVDANEFIKAAKHCQDRQAQLMLACKAGAARELYEETGMDFRNNLDRMEPAQLRALVNVGENDKNKNAENGDQQHEETKMVNELKDRLFFFLQVNDDDFPSRDTTSPDDQEPQHTKQSGDDPDNNHDSENDKSEDLHAPLCPEGSHLRLRLSEEHSGFTFVLEPSKAAELLCKHSRGQCSDALLMAMSTDKDKVAETILKRDQEYAQLRKQQRQQQGVVEEYKPKYEIKREDNDDTEHEESQNDGPEDTNIDSQSKAKDDEGFTETTPTSNAASQNIDNPKAADQKQSAPATPPQSPSKSSKRKSRHNRRSPPNKNNNNPEAQRFNTGESPETYMDPIEMELMDVPKARRRMALLCCFVFPIQQKNHRRQRTPSSPQNQGQQNSHQ